jgi:hypothetical protein
MGEGMKDNSERDTQDPSVLVAAKSKVFFKRFGKYFPSSLGGAIEL